MSEGRKKYRYAEPGSIDGGKDVFVAGCPRENRGEELILLDDMIILYDDIEWTRMEIIFNRDTSPSILHG